MSNQGVLEFQVSAYESQAEQWKMDHDFATQCLEFESLLQFGLNVLEAIHRRDETWRQRVLAGKLPHDPNFQEFVTTLYRMWMKPLPHVSAALKRCEDAGYSVEGSAEFRAACREVEGILTDDAEFFQGEKIVSLRGDAIDAFRENACEPWQTI